MGRLSVSICCLVMALLCSSCGLGGFGGVSREDVASAGSKQATAAQGQGGEAITVYTARHYDADSELFGAFTRKTGIPVREVKGTAEELVAKMQQDGERSPADLFFTVDGGVLDYAKKAGVLQPLRSETIERQVPAEWRDSEYYWIGITKRARVLVYAKDRVKPEELSTYETLTDAKWRGRLLTRSSSSLYNQSLLASFISLNGPEAAERWAAGVAANLARAPEGGDREQALAVVEGVGDVAIMNAYYVGQLSVSADPEETGVPERLGVVFPNQETTGTHMNVSGIGLARHSVNTDKALKLVEFMTSEEGQTLLVSKSFEFPVNEEAALPPLLNSWGTFEAQELDFSELEAHRETALEIFARAGWL